MPIVSGKYVNPGFVNDTAPALDEEEMNDIADTLEMVPIGNGGTGMGSIQTTTAPHGYANVRLYKWGKVVLMDFEATEKFLDSYAEGVIPSEYRPKANFHYVAPAFRNTTSATTASPYYFTSVYVSPAGDIQISPEIGETREGVPRFTVMWFIA